MPDQPQLRDHQLPSVRLRVAEAGDPSDPLVVLVHGWPESWYSWRHQIPALAEAGYRVLAPDMRGYGGSEAPEEVGQYDIFHLCDDLAALIQSAGAEHAAIVGHDWGAIVGWHFALLHPEKVNAVAGLSVPYGGRARVSPLETWRTKHGDDFYYILYFQELDDEGRGVAEQEFDAAPRELLSRLLVSPDTPCAEPELSDPARAAGGMIPRLGRPLERPDWLTDADLDYYSQEFARAGFRGGINYYRNFHRNWEQTPHLEGARVPQPALFVSGAEDAVIRGANIDQLAALLAHGVADLRGLHLLPGIGHWVQQEAPELTNEILLNYLSTAVGSQRVMTTAP
ncbi:MAG: alpha/beta hydrolase [Acidobacteria bacterium]|nr:MAG: alpha/beta hydrolase [Acidobacteriota bacterium]REK03297.1 MAG: alpha/beta hydrolase [Acidobacteriota bacterium]